MLSDLDESERDVICQCLRGAVVGPFIPMWEFSTLFGLEHQQVADIAFAAGPLDDGRLAINNALNWLTGYPHRCGTEVWARFIPVPPGEVRRVLKKWKGTPSRQGLAQDVFDEMM